jgi:AcrR family transcriptional regulator
MPEKGLWSVPSGCLAGELVVVKIGSGAELVNDKIARYPPCMTTTAGERPYHHGDLRRTLLDEALAAIERAGPGTVSLRELARRSGVSHAAPAHHFGDKAGLLTAIAAEGFGLLADELEAAFTRTGSFLEVGVAYVGFAVRHRAHFEVMFRPELLRADDPALTAAQERSRLALYGPIGSIPLDSGTDTLAAGVAAWALVHGLATLYLDGNLPPALGNDPDAIARSIAVHLFAGSSQR